ncbi:hypothetical protein ACQKEN_16895 [Pseudomonas sp. NPDC078416]|uniref:hypothetical protein n=1 Tax=Pseudomonas sp. NPDC078416 TaxID=3390637 RepID=UPI003CFEEE70
MKIAWRTNKKLKPIIILEKMIKIASVLPDGRVSFTGFEKFELDSILFSMIEFHKDFSYSTSKTFYTKSLSRWVASGVHTAESFILELNREAIGYGRKPVSEFVVVTSISIEGGFPKPRIVLPSVSIQSWPSGLPKKYHGRFGFDDMWPEGGDAMPASYCPVVIKFNAKNGHDGVELALAELDYVRGLFCLISNSVFKMALGDDSSLRLPINEIMLGGMHTLHRSDGRLFSSDTYWYEPEYTEVKAKRMPSEKRSAVLDHFTSLNEKIHAHRDAHTIKESIVRYARAFDGRDKNFALQKTWAALETLMAPNDNNTDLLVRRCSYMWRDRLYHRQVLEHIKDYRNRSVHTGRVLDNPSDQCYLLQKYFRQAVIFHASNANVFTDLREANEFLDLSDDRDELVRKSFLIEKAITFLGPAESK